MDPKRAGAPGRNAHPLAQPALPQRNVASDTARASSAAQPDTGNGPPVPPTTAPFTQVSPPVDAAVSPAARGSRLPPLFANDVHGPGGSLSESALRVEHLSGEQFLRGDAIRMGNAGASPYSQAPPSVIVNSIPPTYVGPPRTMPCLTISKLQIEPLAALVAHEREFDLVARDALEQQKHFERSFALSDGASLVHSSPVLARYVSSLDMELVQAIESTQNVLLSGMADAEVRKCVRLLSFPPCMQEVRVADGSSVWKCVKPELRRRYRDLIVQFCKFEFDAQQRRLLQILTVGDKLMRCLKVTGLDVCDEKFLCKVFRACWPMEVAAVAESDWKDGDDKPETLDALIDWMNLQCQLFDERNMTPTVFERAASSVSASSVHSGIFASSGSVNASSARARPTPLNEMQQPATSMRIQREGRCVRCRQVVRHADGRLEHAPANCPGPVDGNNWPPPPEWARREWGSNASAAARSSSSSNARVNASPQRTNAYANIDRSPSGAPAAANATNARTSVGPHESGSSAQGRGRGASNGQQKPKPSYARSPYQLRNAHNTRPQLHAMEVAEPAQNANEDAYDDVQYDDVVYGDMSEIDTTHMNALGIEDQDASAPADAPPQNEEVPDVHEYDVDTDLSEHRLHLIHMGSESARPSATVRITIFQPTPELFSKASSINRERVVHPSYAVDETLCLAGYARRFMNVQIDTGANYSVMSRSYAQAMQLPMWAEDGSQHVVLGDGLTTVPITHTVHLKCELCVNSPVRYITFYVIDTSGFDCVIGLRDLFGMSIMVGAHKIMLSYNLSIYDSTWDETPDVPPIVMHDVNGCMNSPLRCRELSWMHADLRMLQFGQMTEAQKDQQIVLEIKRQSMMMERLRAQTVSDLTAKHTAATVHAMQVPASEQGAEHVHEPTPVEKEIARLLLECPFTVGDSLRGRMDCTDDAYVAFLRMLCSYKDVVAPLDRNAAQFEPFDVQTNEHLHKFFRSSSSC